MRRRGRSRATSARSAGRRSSFYAAAATSDSSRVRSHGSSLRSASSTCRRTGSARRRSPRGGRPRRRAGAGSGRARRRSRTPQRRARRRTRACRARGRAGWRRSGRGRAASPSSRSPCTRCTCAPRRSAFARRDARARAQVSLAQTSICGARSASVTAITPEPVPMSATRAGRSPIRSSAASTSCSVVARGVNTRPGSVTKVSPWKSVLHRSLVQRSPMDWIPGAEAKKARYEEQHGELDERSLVRQGNTAYAAGSGAADGRRPSVGRMAAAGRGHAGARAGAGGGSSWGRPIGALKASLLAGDDAAARGARALGARLGAADRRIADRPVRGGARAALARALARGAPRRGVAARARRLPARRRRRARVHRGARRRRLHRGGRSVVESFETRDEYLEDMPVADTALVLAGARAAARHRGVAARLRRSCRLSPSRPA